MGGENFRIDLLKDLPNGSDLGNRGIDTDGRHFTGLRGNNALPAKQRWFADEFQRVEGHLDGQPVGGPANQGGNDRDTEVLPEFLGA